MLYQANEIAQKPPWLRMKLPVGPNFGRVQGVLHRGQLHTVCQEALCPNRWECFSQKTATFLILGSRCTRRCAFCAISHGPLSPFDPDEPLQVAMAAKEMGLSYVVVTSVTRDDLPDGGAGAFSETIGEIRRMIPGVKVEVLIPDFSGNDDALQVVMAARPDVLNHNIETCQRLYPKVRPGALYHRSLSLIRKAGKGSDPLFAKSGMMVGLGESDDEIRETLEDLLDAGCQILTLGQYLQPSRKNLPVDRFLPPERFAFWREEALMLGFSQVASGPFVRSSYHADDLYSTVTRKEHPKCLG